MRSSHKNTANYEDSSHKNTVPHRPCISCRHSPPLTASTFRSPSSCISTRQWLSLSLTAPLHASPYPALAQSPTVSSPTVSSPTVSSMPIPSPITISSTSTHQLQTSSIAPPGMSLPRQSLSPSPPFPPISITPRQSPSLMSPRITCSLALQYPPYTHNPLHHQPLFIHFYREK